MSGILYVVGTPIGNLGDWSPRAKEVLLNSDFIAAEDTRVTLKLLNKFEINTPMVSYHEHNHKTRSEQIIARLLSGESCALVTDAGMPAVSDPGEELVCLAHKNGITVNSVPGPSAVITALAISGMPSGRFSFEGFLSTAKLSRKEHLESLKNDTRTLIFYEAPHKLQSTLKDMLTVFGERDIALCKELTKLHETVIHTTFSGALSTFEATPPKGEYVLIVSGAKEEEKQEITLEQAVAFAKKQLNEGQSASMAAKLAAAYSGIKKSDIYKALIEQ
ncbi:MAG: 16S rRNA (cytidine(1402)-2'-O)-methyltransferase [Clostridia bacterium]|nr:16S rRNA (cytidine(1402)-2'-O)-methyltransferase [Clostridia bacterium]